MNNISLSHSNIEAILDPLAIRTKAREIFQLTKEGKTSFEWHEDKLEPTIQYVVSVIHKNYPDLNIPFHSRWGHFRAGGVDRVKIFDKKLADLSVLEKCRVKLDLVITSVLLDAGAGMQWKFQEGDKFFSKSEGLALASLEMFAAGVMSSDGKSLRADMQGLQKVSADDLRKFFQVSDNNPLVGVDGRVSLLNNLGRALKNKKYFCEGRPGNLVDYLITKYGSEIPAVAVLKAVLKGFGSIWPGRISANEIPLGDVWSYSKLGAPGTYASLVPFHKLSQWMTYSLLEPMMEAGLTIVRLEELTGLPEYRNGGLLLDSGLITLKDKKDYEKTWTPDSDLIIEWRGLTIYLLDEIATGVRKALKQPEFPLAKVLEGGTWWAGRFLAKEKRADGGPPLKIQSDGTVF